MCRPAAAPPVHVQKTGNAVVNPYTSTLMVNPHPPTSLWHLCESQGYQHKMLAPLLMKFSGPPVCLFSLNPIVLAD